MSVVSLHASAPNRAQIDGDLDIVIGTKAGAASVIVNFDYEHCVLLLSFMIFCL